MKRFWTDVVLVLLVGLLPALPAARADEPGPEPPQRVYAAQTRQAVLARSRQVVAALQAGNLARVAPFVHPTKGLRFSPYVFVDPKHDRVFTRAQVRQLGRDQRRYLWGRYDGTGKPIRLTFRQYRQRFLVDKNFARVPAGSVHVNAFTRRGNARNNLASVYPGAVAVEYYVPGTGAHKDFNWRSLWLVWEKRGGVWYLVGIAHNQWTI